MTKHKVSDWPSAVKVLEEELNRQALEISVLKTQVAVLQALLVRTNVLDQATLDRVFEACAKTSDQKDHPNEAIELRSLKSDSQPLAEILPFPVNEDPPG
ncbi:MAG: hypothetical protein BM560_05160 [Roseobacter sp. MedPE-SWde]|nr:MAG: hypothetical protein BM560_05160 [Roseobacter sp. MedPE-SWde]